MALGLVSPVFVGRAGELSKMMAALESAIDSDSAVVIVGGEAGVGKTRLVEEVAVGARRAGVRVLTGCCVALGGAGLALSPVVDALRPLLRAMGPDELEALLGPARDELARLLPELAWADGPNSVPISEEGNARLLELVFGVIQRLAAERPVMLVIEDLHWADRSTLDLVALLVRALRGMRVLLVVTFRSDDLNRGHLLRAVMIDWERVRSVRRLELQRFSLQETAGQLEAILGKPPARSMLELVYERSEGNAFLSEEILGALQAGASLDEVPRTLRDMLLVRAERLSATAFELLRVASVAGRSVPDRLLSMVSDLDDPGLDEALREAVEHHLLIVDSAGEGYRFRHALTRDAIYQDVLPRERVRIHRAYAEALSSDRTLASSEASQAAGLALHWSAAHDLPRALVASVDAARLTSGYAPAEALKHFEHALELWPGVPDAASRCGMDLADTLRLAAASAQDAGELERSEELYDDALAELEGSDDTERVACVLEAKAHVVGDLGRREEGGELLERVLEMLPTEPASVARATAQVQLLLWRWIDGDDVLDDVRVAAEQAVAVAEAAGGSEHEARSRMWLGVSLNYLGEAQRGIDELRRSIELAEELGATTLVLRAYLNLTDTLLQARRHGDAAEAAGRALELAARVGLSRTTDNTSLVAMRAEGLFALGRWSEAQELLSDAIDSGPSPSLEGAYLFALRGTIAALSGRSEQAARDIDAADAARAHNERQTLASFFTSARALAALARGEDAVAREMVRERLQTAPDAGSRHWWRLLWIAMRIEAEAPERRHDPMPWLRSLPDQLRDMPPGPRIYFALFAAEGSRVGGDAPPDWAAAIAAARAEGDPFLQAYALLRGAEQAIEAGDRESAPPMLQESVLLSEEIGAEPLLAEARTFARRVRVRLGDARWPTPVDLGAVDSYGLTERELEVFRLVAVGRSNRQIAAELFISPKTASVHVSNLIGKLAVSSRTEAAALAHRIGVSG